MAKKKRISAGKIHDPAPKTKRFEVLVSRISYSSRNIIVDAKNEKEAKKLALDEAGNQEFSEHDADYKVDGVLPLKS